jgi:hypothetical protein
MEDITPDFLLECINEQPSQYEERYAKWVSISYNKVQLLELLYELKFLKETSDPNHERISFLENILHDNDIEHLYLLLINVEQTARLALIEKYARVAAMEMLIRGKYTVETLNVITQFPIADYQLTVKRVQELVSLISDVTTQSTTPITGVAGV